MTFFVAGHSAIIYVKFGKDRSYHSGDTAILLNGDVGLHFQGQMIRSFITGHAIMVGEKLIQLFQGQPNYMQSSETLYLGLL